MKIDIDGRSCCLPDFMIVGAPRCGTTSLYRYLRSHPAVFMPDEKEPMYFAGLGPGLHAFSVDGVEDTFWIPETLQDYERLFQKARPHQIIGEASTWYLSQYERVIPHIRRVYGEYSDALKIMIMLRHPVDRMWSHWLLKRTTGREALPFETVIDQKTAQQRISNGFVPSYDYRVFSTYADAVKAWKEAFPQTRVWIFEEFFSDVASHMTQVMDYLDLNVQQGRKWGKVVNASGEPRNRISAGMLHLMMKKTRIKDALKQVLPMRYRRRLKRDMIRLLVEKRAMDPALHLKLQDIFQEDIAQLEQVLGRGLQSWRTGCEGQGTT